MNTLISPFGRVLIASALIVAGHTSASAANVWWTGGVTGTTTWNSASSWTTGTIPTVSDFAYFNQDSTTARTFTVDIGSGATAGNVNLYGTATTTTLNLTLLGTAGGGAFTLGSGGSINVQANRTITFSCDVASAGSSVTFAPRTGGTVNLSSGYTVSATITKNDGGVLNINGNVNSGANTLLTVNAGVVNWNPQSYTSTSTSNQVLFVGGLYATGATGAAAPATLNLYKSFDSNGGIIVGYGATKDSNAALFGAANGVTISDNIIANAAGTGGAAVNTITLGANDTAATAGNPTTVTFAGKYTINDTNARTHSFFAAANNTAIFNGIIGGSNSGSIFKKTGAGTVIFGGAAANTYSSAVSTEVTSGTLQLQKTSGVALTSGTVTIDSGATLLLAGASQINSAANLFLAGGTFNIQSYGQTLANVQLASSASILGSSGTLSATGSYDFQSGTVSANLSGAAGLTKSTTDTVTLSGSNTYSGATQISAGRLDINGSVGSASAVSIASGATLGGSGTVFGTVTGTNATLNGNGLTTGVLTLDGTSVLLGTTHASSLVVRSGTASNQGTTTASTGTLTVKAGATLNNTGSASAATVTVESTASLKNNGTLSASSVSVSGLLSGTGTITGALTIESGGELAPGNSPGTITVDGTLTVQSGAKVSAQLDSLSSYDRIVADGVSLSGTLALDLSDAFLAEAAALTSGQTLTLIENTSLDAIQNVFTSITYTASGETTTVSGDAFTIGSVAYSLSYTGGTDHNDLTLTLAVVPEPSSWALLAGGIGLLLGLQCVRRRAE